MFAKLRVLSRRQPLHPDKEFRHKILPKAERVLGFSPNTLDIKGAKMVLVVVLHVRERQSAQFGLGECPAATALPEMRSA